MTKSELIADITTSLKDYDEAGLVDYISIDFWIKNALKEFGGNLMEASETTIEVIDGKANLPENFYSLALALKCNPYGYSCSDEETKKHLQSSFFYKERLENQIYWDNQTGEVPCVEGEDCRHIVEAIYFHDKTKKASIYYNNIEILRLVQGYKKVKCDKGCPNLMEYESPYEISIHNNIVQCNFESGYIYMRYRGLPTDDDGELLIPEIQRNKIQEYIKYTCIRRTLENLMLSSDDPNVGQKLAYFEQKERETYHQAKNDATVEGMLGWKDRIKYKNRRYTRKFELMYSSL